MEKLVIVKTMEQLQELLDYIQDKPALAFDTETTGVERDASIIGFSLSCDASLAYYVITRRWDVESQSLICTEVEPPSIKLIEALANKNLIMQNGNFDCMMARENYGIELIDYLAHDTLLSGHLLDENRQNGLKERGVALYGEDAAHEQKLMKESVVKNGGQLTKNRYELYKADADLIAYYGAKDAILTWKVFCEDSIALVNEGLDAFFYDDESMPLFRGPTYDMNTTGLRVDAEKLQKLKLELEAENLELKGYIYDKITPLVRHEYPGTGKTNTFNIGSATQRNWLLFHTLKNEFHILTKEGKELCKALGIQLPYSYKNKLEFTRLVSENKDRVWQEPKYNWKTKKMTSPKKVRDYWCYMSSGKDTLKKFEEKYTWVKKFLQYTKNDKLLKTYVNGIQSKMKYNIIRPSFLQHGTTSGRYSSKSPNFQNLPRDDKRIKACIISRPGKVFVGADYSQLEPRVFASFSGDERLLACFREGLDFYSVIGQEVFDKYDTSLNKDAVNSFANLYPKLRNVSKAVGLSATYGTTAFKMAPAIGKSPDECQEIINSYFEKFPRVLELMLSSHEQVKAKGYVTSLFGRPRRLPMALEIPKVYGKRAKHADLPYEARGLLNQAINHRIQSTGASIVNRAAIAVWKECKARGWSDVKIVLQVHDELVLEGPEELAEQMAEVLKDCMENTSILPGVALIAEPKIAKNLADLK